MGQCFSVLSRRRCQNKVRPLEVKNDGRKDGEKEMWNVEKKEKGKEIKLEVQQNGLDENVYQNKESDIKTVLKDYEEGFDRVQNETNVHEEMNEDKNKTDDINNAVKITKDGNLSAFSVENSTNTHIIAVQLVEEKSFPVESRDDISNITGKELVNPASMLIPQNAKGMPCLCLNYEQDIKTQKKEDKQANTERCQVEKREWKHIPKSESLNKNRMNEYQHEIDSQDKIFGKDNTSLSTLSRDEKIAHLSVRNQLFGDVMKPFLPERNFWLPDDTKETMMTTKNAIHKQSVGRYRDNLHGEKLPSSYEWNTQALQNDKAVADKIHKTSRTSSNSYKSEPSKVFSTTSSSSEDNLPYWALPGHVASTCWNKQHCLTYKPDNVETEMRNIDSEMAVLLKPDEKTSSITFTICEKTRAKTRRKTPLKRLEEKQRNEVNKEKLHEKQKNAERRRNENIAKRIQSARRWSKRKEISNGNLHDKIIERIEAAIGRREDILEQRVQVAQKSSQIKTDVVKSREIETANVKKQVLEKIGAATVRRDDVIDQKLQVVIKYRKLRRNTDKQVDRTKEHVFEKIEKVTFRRNEFLKKRVKKSSVSNRGDVVKEKLAEIQQTDLIRKLKISQENRERILRQTVRRQVILEKRRELARRRLARIKQEQDEGHLRFVELETYNYDESDESEHAWE